MDFDIDANSNYLKSFLAKYDPDLFMGDIANLLALNDTPRMGIYPFQGLDSPLRQLTYIGSLNLSSDPALVTEHRELQNEEWQEIVKTTIKVKAGYFDLLMPKEGDDTEEYAEIYKVAMPVFMNFYDTGALVYEEQTLERIQRLFTQFDCEIEQKTGLKTVDFITIYNLLDNAVTEQLNLPLKLIRDTACKQYWDTQMAAKIHPFDWTYDGENEAIQKLVEYANKRGERYTINIAPLKELYAPDKIDAFLALFSISRSQTDYLFYTSPNPLLERPIYRLSDGRYLVVSIQQLFTSIYMFLTNLLVSAGRSISERFYTKRGNYLEEKTIEVFDNFFEGAAHIHSEYAVVPFGDEQDILILYKGLALIIEAKAGREAEPMRNVRKSFEKIGLSFKKAIQEGYDQSWRIKQFFEDGREFDIYDKEGKLKFHVNPRKYHNYFSIIVTLNRFREPQINLDLLLTLHDDDPTYPFSLCIDDLEVVLLAMKRMKKGVGDLIRFLDLRQQLQGRTRSSDELEIWGALLNSKSFKIPENEHMHFATNPTMADFYDDLYKKGLGFKNEKNFKEKRSGKFIFFEPSMFWKAAKRDV